MSAASAERTWPLSGLDESVLRPLWLDTEDRPEPRATLIGEHETDLLVIGGGFAGLWTALRAVEREPGRRVLLIEADRIAEHATGRNGGFCEASLTHGEANGRSRWPEEYETIHRMGRENLTGIAETVTRYRIDCGFARGGALVVATRDHQIPDLSPEEPGFLDAAQTRGMVDSPTYLAGRFSPEDCAVLDPARLAWGLTDAAEDHGARIAERTRLQSLRREGESVVATTGAARIRAAKVALATNAFPNPLRRARLDTVPVYDYVLATEPLSQQQLRELHWDPAIGVSDCANQFHYYRVTPDRRILWGGYDAIYHFGKSIDPAHEDRTETFETLARHFGETFPQLKGIRFTHRWSGVIDTSTRFCAMFGQAHGGRTAYAVGFTGLGVGATRFAADVMLDRLAGEDTERTRLAMVRRRPPPFPPEPLAWAGIRLSIGARAREDETGRPSLWLKAMDKVGLGFDS